MFEITSGKIQRAKKVVIYGPEGIGKSTFASQFPNTIFSDIEGSTVALDVRRLPKPTSWTMLLQQALFIKANPTICNTYAIDTADWAEKLCLAQICANKSLTGIEDMNYGKGYVYLAEEWGKWLNLLEDLIEIGINVVITAHAFMRKFEQPDELGSYDRWELKLQKKTAPLLKEWADMVLFANYKTIVVNVDGQGATKGKNKAQGGQRVMYTTHHPCWDAKNRYGLPDEISFNYNSIAHIIGDSVPTNIVNPTPEMNLIRTESSITVTSPVGQDIPVQQNFNLPDTLTPTVSDNVPKELRDLMVASGVAELEIQTVVYDKGIAPIDMPISEYPVDFILGELVAKWQNVFKAIQEYRDSQNMQF